MSYVPPQIGPDPLANLMECRRAGKAHPEDWKLALLGEMDWTEEFLMQGGTVAELIKAEPSGWQEVCPECLVHRGHKADCQSQTARGGGDYSIEAYRNFVRNKCRLSQDSGFVINDDEIHPWLKKHQRLMVQWAARGGRRAVFASFGLGKSVVQLELLRLISERTGGRGLIVAPLGVRQEFRHDARAIGIDCRFIHSIDEADDTGIYLTNYETVRDGRLDPAAFGCASLDEAAVLRSFGGTKTFREFMRLFEMVPYRFVATATPDPNQYIELLAYSAFLGVMDVSAAKTRFFKRDSTKADQLTIHPHKEREFWLWVASWALFVSKPSDLCACPCHDETTGATLIPCAACAKDDEGYELPGLTVIQHEIAVQHSNVAPERDGQGRMYREAMHGIQDAAREKRETTDLRIAKAVEIAQSQPGEHVIFWHDLETERKALERALPEIATVYGAQRGNAAQLEKLEQAIEDFAEGRIPYLGAKPQMFGAGANFQYHCARAIFCGIGFKFNDFIQACHRIVRFLQNRPVELHLIYAESERRILQVLLEKWERYKQQTAKMSQIIRQYGLSQKAMEQALARTLGVNRFEVKRDDYTLINNDCVEELQSMPADSVGLVLTSIPFSTQYEYSPAYEDFGHTSSNEHFWQQMDFLITHLLRVLKPGRIAAIHVKDRIVPGGITGLGFQTVYPFHMDCTRAFIRHGFGYMGMKTIVTDVVRENNQTYRLGWTEQCKDGTKMGVGMPEYLLIFRKPPTDTTNSYADTPVVKVKPTCEAEGKAIPFRRDLPITFNSGYSRSRWQVDAHGFARSSGNRLLTPEELDGIPHSEIFQRFKKRSLSDVYDFEQHVRLGEHLERNGILPVTFMLLQPQSWSPEVWTDITRMLTLNSTQYAKGREMHLCPMQFDLADRAIAQYTMPGEVVLDPFMGIGTVPYRALLLGRKAIGIELSQRYFADACGYAEAAQQKAAMPSLFDCFVDSEVSA